MATNEVLENAFSVTVPIPAGVVSGDPIVLGTLVGVAVISRTADGKTTMRRKGSYNLTVTGAINAGDTVYAVVAGGLVTSLTATVGTNTRFGTSLTTQAATGVCEVVLGYP